MDDIIRDDFTTCPRCGAACEEAPGPADGYIYRRCPDCGWSKLIRITVLDETWLDLGAYCVEDDLPGVWRAYLPGDRRRAGLADWQLVKPRIISIDVTIQWQQAFIFDILWRMTHALEGITKCATDAQILRKLDRCQKHINAIVDAVPQPKKETKIMMEAADRREKLFFGLISCFLPAGFRTREATAEQIAPYLWGYEAMLYFWWTQLLAIRKNCNEAIIQAGMSHALQGLTLTTESLCSRFQAEHKHALLSDLFNDKMQASYKAAVRMRSASNKKNKKKRRK